MSEQKPLLISFSGGRTSAFMAKYLIERFPKREKAIVFANTGKEREESYEFIRECDLRWNLGVVWVEAVVNPQKGIGTKHKIVTFETASRNGEPFEDMIAKYGVPNLSRPFCPRELKIRPIHSYVKSLGWDDYENAQGIRSDELERVKGINKREFNEIYPLVDDIKVSKDFIRSWWDKQDFDLQLKDYEGNCDICWKKSDRKLFTLAKDRPEKFSWWSLMEKKYGTKDGFTFFRNNRSAKEILSLGNNMPESDRAIDEHDASKKQQKFDFMMDYEKACVCKST